jgi:hypothetical protein
MPTVWIVNNCGHPYEDAKRFGELESLTIGNVNPLRPDRLCWNIAQGIAKYASEKDFLLVSGTPTVNMLALELWLGRFGYAQLLQWNAKKKEYELSVLKRDHMLTLLEQAMTGT